MTSSLSSDRQLEIFRQGSLVPVAAEKLEATARASLPPEVFDYLSGGAGAEATMHANLDAFRRWQIVPRVLRDVSTRDWSISLLGAKLPAPVLLAPIGVQGILHPDADVASGRAAASLDLPLILSTVSSKSIEEVASAMGDTPRWFQLYWSSDLELAESFLSRAERGGYGAIVVTVDAHVLGWRERDLANAYSPFVQGHGAANYLTDPVFRRRLGIDPAADPSAAARLLADLFGNPALDWASIAWLRERTRLPVVIKGILAADDAARAVDVGAAAIVVSNHGGRQVDGAIGTLDALPDVVDRVAGGIPVLLDGGIRRGADAFKAIALGAAGILLGRPYAWGLAIGGEAGVREVLLNFLSDLDLTFALSGCSSTAEVARPLVRPAP
ncbi:MAG TPA: alpha-hydroxy-acid oxidizing protein [Gemmatimonadales bacterium]|nr:alpha-hydroxy-acid oxidizing protein [Gemmatimonadales bacterium]